MKKYLTLNFVVMMILTQGIAALSAQNNSFGLVYENALKENIEGKVLWVLRFLPFKKG